MFYCWLQGLPISVKDHIDQVGFDSTLGLACRTFKPSSEDSLLVKVLHFPFFLGIQAGDEQLYVDIERRRSDSIHKNQRASAAFNERDR